VLDRVGSLSSVGEGSLSSSPRVDVSPSMVVRSKLELIHPPSPFVVVSQGWPSCLCTILTLGLPLAGAFFPVKFHQFFEQSDKHKWLPLPSLSTTSYADSVVYIICGDHRFLESAWTEVGKPHAAILCLNINHRVLTGAKRNRVPRAAQHWMNNNGFDSLVVRDQDFKGITTARFVMGFGRDLENLRTPSSPRPVAFVLSTFLDGGVDSRHAKQVRYDSLPPVKDCPRAPIWNSQHDFLRSEGLLPANNPDALVVCPTHFSRTAGVLRSLSLQERLRLYHIPREMDPQIINRLQSPYPFEETPTPAVFDSIFRQLWGVYGGGVGLDDSDIDGVGLDDSDIDLEAAKSAHSSVESDPMSVESNCQSSETVDTVETAAATVETATIETDIVPATGETATVDTDTAGETNAGMEVEAVPSVAAATVETTVKLMVETPPSVETAPPLEPTTAHNSLTSTSLSLLSPHHHVAERLMTDTPTSPENTSSNDMPAQFEGIGGEAETLPDDELSIESDIASVVDRQWQFDFADGLETIFPSSDGMHDIISTSSSISSLPSDDHTTTSAETLVTSHSLNRVKSVLNGLALPSQGQHIQRSTDPYVDPLLTHESTTKCNDDSGGSIAGVLIEPHEIGPTPAIHAGPPYPVGDVVMCHRVDNHAMRAFVVESEHPRYLLQLEDGTWLDTSAEKVHLVARYKTGAGTPFADDVDDPFVEIRSQTFENKGSFGLVHDSLLKSLGRVKEEKAYAKATKADDAAVPIEFWDNQINLVVPPTVKSKVLNWARSVGHRKYIRRLTEDCYNHLHAEFGEDWTSQPRKSKGKLTRLGREQHAINHIIWHATNTTWFEYKAGTRLVHFRWPKFYQKMVKDGVPVFFETEPPTTKEPQPPIHDADTRAKIRAKIDKVLYRRYMVGALTSGVTLKSWIRYFGVPKGEFDIRVVYDGTANGLNDSIFTPTFWLPTIDTLTRALGSTSWMADRDVMDMFLNFTLHHSALPFTGVDLRPLIEEGEDGMDRLALWVRNAMGLKPSPYNSIKTALVGEEVCRGDRHNTNVGPDGKEENPFQWDYVRLNLPGPKYDPLLSWVAKIRKDGLLACELMTFVDDERIVAPTRELAYQAGHRVAAIQAYLGIMDSARKVRPPSQTSGAWAGSVVHVIPELGVCQLTSEEKWNRMKNILSTWRKRLENGMKMLPHSELLSHRGFLVYVTRTYPPMVPYLKGFHLAAEMWRGGRDAEGWRLPAPTTTNSTVMLDDDSSVESTLSLSSLDFTRAAERGLDIDQAASFDLATQSEDEEAAVSRVYRQHGIRCLPHAPESGLTPTVPRLLDDIKALQQLTASELPALRVVRPKVVIQVYYGFGDAAGTGFGATIAGDFNCKSRLSSPAPNKQGVNYRLGIWDAQESLESSNWKEFTNLVDFTEEEAEAGRLRNCEFFLFTDNSTAASCFYRGSSKSKKLHALIIRLRKLEMKYGLLIHLIHISGKRMIAQGTDGCSRGFLMEGVMAGDNMLDFVDLAKSAVERSPSLIEWIRSWSVADLKPLSPEGWFEEGHGISGGTKDRRGVWIPNHMPKGRTFLWTPPPAAADVALEELCKARHKRTDTYHVVAIPRIMQPRWRRLFNKVCDFTFSVSPGPSFWPDGMFEPLWVGIVLPFTHHRPWCLKRAPKLLSMARELREVLRSGDGEGRDVLRQLFDLPKRIAPLSERVASGVLHMPRRGQVPTRRDTR